MENTKEKLICLDDDPSILKAVKRLLSEKFDVYVYENPAEVFDQLESEKIAILIADLRLPTESGLEVLKKAKVLSPTTVRVILSGQIDMQDMMVAVNQADIDRFILKPWNNEYFQLQMFEALQTHLLLCEKKQLQHLAITDTVTGLRNHRFFQENLKTEIERCQRHRRSLSLIMIDIDYFKNLNDELGHPVGDRALAKVANAIEEEVRAVDTVARYGGEEFAVILPETGIDQAYEVSERLRTKVSQIQIENSKNITISLGVTELRPDEDSKTLIERADQALYQSKNQGRNYSTVIR